MFFLEKISGRVLPPRRFAGVLAVASMLLASGCYLPVRFDAEIEVDRAGRYSMVFDGYLAHLPLYREITAGETTPEDEQERVARLARDFTRDSAVKAFEYVKQGIFKLRWEKSGSLARSPMVTFHRRNEAMLTLSYVREKGLVTVRGGEIRSSVRQQILDAGLNVQGELRLITDARVADHNAARVRKLGEGREMYIWRIRSVFDATPKLVLIPG